MLKISKAFLLLFFILSTYSFAYNIIEENSANLSSSQMTCSASNFPTTNSKHIIAIDRKTLSILYEKDAYSKTAMASTTKIMTCILAIENLPLDKTINISKKASIVSGSTLGLKENDEITVYDLLYGLMLKSRK